MGKLKTTLELKIIPNTTLNYRRIREILQESLDLLYIGHYRYGIPNAKKLYFTRLRAELRAYKRSGIRQHLINIINYAILEILAPEHPNHHWSKRDPNSVTRHLGGEKYHG